MISATLRFLLVLPLLQTLGLFAAPPRETLPFDSNWKFLRGDSLGAEAPAFDDASWRVLDLPHDWSIEDLPPGPPPRVGPFDPAASQGADKTGHTVGGTGWYRKHFTLPADSADRRAAILFDGVYMNADVWLNGHHLGDHPNGYTSFEFDLTPFLNPPGAGNVLAVRVRNEGKNSRWYSGSGIYRHVWLLLRGPVNIPTWGLSVTTPEVSPARALVSLSTEIANTTTAPVPDILVRARILDASGRAVATAQTTLALPPSATRVAAQSLEIPAPALWSPDSPALYTAEVELLSGDRKLDALSVPFGIRSIKVDASRGLLLNGRPFKLLGGCVHHDNGPLGAAAIDRAEERRVELLKANGFNAVRCAHNPPSPAFLDACDRLGLLVIDEAFDQWNVRKLDDAQDYHLYFKDWFARDIASFVRRDRDHPSVIMWSIGNEIPEQFHPGDTAKLLRAAVLSHDATRPITQAVSTDWGKVARHWDALSDPAFVALDVAGYNYLSSKYESDHARHPDRVMMTTESYPKDCFDEWTTLQKHPYVIGDFVWSAIDYLGESGIGHSVLSDRKNTFFTPWPWFDAWCGDLDICGFKKPQSLYRDVVWGRRPIALLVHAPIPAGLTEHVSDWGWPDEWPSWTWPGHEGQSLQVSLYARADAVRLTLNGKVIGEKPVSAATKLAARFDVPYAPGKLDAFALVGGRVIAETTLETAGPAAAIKLDADRALIRADRADLSYVTVQIVDAQGRRVPDAATRVHFAVTGPGELAAQAGGAPDQPASFRAPDCTTFHGRCLAILRPEGPPGAITLRVTADGLPPATLTVRTQP